MRYVDVAKNIIDEFVFTTQKVDYRDEYNLIAGECSWFYDLFCHNTYQINNHTFHNKTFVDFIKDYEPTKLSYDEALNSDKKVILEFSLHTCANSPKPHQSMKDNFFDKLLQDNILIQKMKNNQLVILIYQGWEAQNFTEKTKEEDTIDCYYELFQNVFKQYNIPNTSIVMMGSNMNGYEYEKNYNFKYCKVNAIFDNLTEIQSFIDIPINYTNYFNYSVDDYIDNIKKCDKKLLRISRTKNKFRDFMLYYLHKRNYIDDCVIEHPDFSTFQLDDFMDIDESIITKIKNDLPYVASYYEKNIQVDDYSNKVIPHDVYKKTIFTWASTSLPEQIDKVFINQSTFKPILFYHPLVIHSQPNHIHHLKKSGYKSYDWLFDESLDTLYNHEWETKYQRLWKNIKSIDKVMNMTRDELVGVISENKKSLQHNRDLLFKCESIERIIRKFYEIAS